MQYSYSFSEELDQEWHWTEKYSPQPEILNYANHVADRFDLRRDIHFHTCVTSAVFDETIKRWRIETDHGDAVTAQFCITAVGCLSAANTPDFDGIEDFDGPIYHTGNNAHDGVDFNGLRVGVIGTGSSGIQSDSDNCREQAVIDCIPAHAELRWVTAWNEAMDLDYERRWSRRIIRR